MLDSDTGRPYWDAIVVGCGPAGAAAALHLAQRGLRVLVLEKSSWPRYKTCGGGLVRRARCQIEADLDDCIEAEAVRAELHLHDLERSFHVTRRHSLVSMTMRSRLDDALVRAAQHAGAKLETSVKVEHLRRLGDSVEVGGDGGLFRGRYLVLADGAAGETALLAGWSRNRGLIPAIESEIQTDAATLRRFSGVARFDFGLVPAGYAWVFPKREGLSVGCLSWRRHRPDLKSHLSSYLRRIGIQPYQREDHGFVIPVLPRARRLAESRVLLTGDCAGLVDPVTGEGITNALVSGRLAAAAIQGSAPSGGIVEERYQRLLERFVLRELRYARLLASALYRRPRWRRLAFRRLGQPLSESMAEIICGSLTYRELLTSPTRYLRMLTRLLLHPGPYPKG